MDRRVLADFLRSRRERITPAEVGLPAGPRRRAPGLRREEVAQPGYISTEYYTRLEQARAPHPSHEVLAGLARALRLADAERDHLHHLAGAPPPQAAATVTSATFEVLAWNNLAAVPMEDFSALPRRDRNLVRRLFLGPHTQGQRLYGVSDADAFTRFSTRRLRAVAARYPDDPEVAELVAELRDESEEFTRLRESHTVSAEPTLCKTFQHPLVGPVTVNCRDLHRRPWLALRTGAAASVGHRHTAHGRHVLSHTAPPHDFLSGRSRYVPVKPSQGPGSEGAAQLEREPPALRHRHAGHDADRRGARWSWFVTHPAQQQTRRIP